MTFKERKLPEKYDYRHTTEEGDEDKSIDIKKLKREILRHAENEWSSFKEEFKGVINSFFGTPDIEFTVKPGGWYITLEGKIQVNADPEFFIDLGFTESEALFATLHEASHFLDMISNRDAYTKLLERVKGREDVHKSYPRALFGLYNCIDDVLVNRIVMNKWSKGNDTKDSLYPKLFPNTDFRSKPKHIQLQHALLRKIMIPDEEVVVNDEVQEVIESWLHRGGNKNILDDITSVTLDGKSRIPAEKRYNFILATLEPAFEKFYKWDLENYKHKKSEDNEDGEKSEKYEDSETGDNNPFDEDNDGNFDPIDFEDLIEQINKKMEEKKEKNFKDIMGVEQIDFDNYKKDYNKVERYIKQLSDHFKRIIQKRISVHRVLKKPVKEGPVLDPKKVAIGFAEIKAGNYEPRIFLDYQEKERISKKPSRIEFTLVCDGSGSMQDGKRDVIQRLISVLAMEAFSDFQQGVEKEKRKGKNINLDIYSEVRIFSDHDQVVKPLSKSLTHIERVEMRKKLEELPGGGNNEIDTLKAIESEQFNKKLVKELQSGDVKKIIVFLTDGETDINSVQSHIQKLYKYASSSQSSSLIIAGIGFEGGETARQTYAPNGHYVDSLESLPDAFNEILLQILEDV